MEAATEASNLRRRHVYRTDRRISSLTLHALFAPAETGDEMVSLDGVGTWSGRGGTQLSAAAVCGSK